MYIVQDTYYYYLDIYYCMICTYTVRGSREGCTGGRPGPWEPAGPAAPCARPCASRIRSKKSPTDADDSAVKPSPVGTDSAEEDYPGRAGGTGRRASHMGHSDGPRPGPNLYAGRVTYARTPTGPERLWPKLGQAGRAVYGQSSS